MAFERAQEQGQAEASPAAEARAADVPSAPSAAPFDAWLAAFRTEARAAGVSDATLDAAFKDIALNPRVIELDRKQPEFTLTYQKYIGQRLSDLRIQKGIEKFRAHEATLRAVGKKYGVDPYVIAAIWGLETNYGGFTGGFSVVQSLATLAFDARRSDYFRRELINALKIIDNGDITAAEMKGSWAGAMGQSQFMPSSFLNFAQDYDGDHKRDIWGNAADVFASIANYLAKNGWRSDGVWGRPVSLPEDFDSRKDQVFNGDYPRGCSRAMKEHSVMLPLPEWQEFGVRRLSGANLPARNIPASLVRMDNGDGPSYLTYDNYRAILSYNCSNYYALAVGLLADRIKQGMMG